MLLSGGAIQSGSLAELYVGFFYITLGISSMNQDNIFLGTSFSRFFSKLISPITAPHLKEYSYR